MIVEHPVIPVEELRKRYEALGPIEESIGERTYAGRCCTFESFLGYGRPFAMDLQDMPRIFRDFPYPGLINLVQEAWPDQ